MALFASLIFFKLFVLVGAKHLFVIGSKLLHFLVTNKCFAPTCMILSLLQNPQPIPQQELDAADKQRQPAHDRIAEGRAKGDHEKPDTNL